MIPVKAVNIDETYRFCDPDIPLEANDNRYVDLSASRGIPKIAESIARNISRVDKLAYLQLLFTGHRGSGKTTELLRLKQTLENKNFFIVYFDVEDILDLGSLSHLDVLVAIAKQTQLSLYHADIPLSEKLLENISAWFSERIIEDGKLINHERYVEGGGRATFKIPFFKLFSKLTANIKSSSSHRETIRCNLKREMSVFIDKLNLLVKEAREAVQSKGHTDLVIIVDGLEKMHYDTNPEGQSTYSELFVRHAEQLRSPECHIIYTVPIFLAYNQNLGSDFDDIKVLPMVNTKEEGIEQLIEIIKRRVDVEQVFDDLEQLKVLAKMSGGVVRDLMRLIRMSTETDADKISEADVAFAVNTLKKQYDRLIRNEDISIFKQIKMTKRVQSDEAFARPLDLRLILEYENGSRWADLHPAVESISWVKEALCEPVEQ
ncbi:MAG: hypothetical protein KAG19_08545 [Methylococcales bacterium]|nr:hypothetical protein [Methylococcales bacterium]